MRKKEEAESLIAMTLLDDLCEEYRLTCYQEWVTGGKATRGKALAAEEVLGFIRNRCREIIHGE